jgi:hypothetical protein
MAIEEQDLGAALVEVGVDVVRTGHGGEAAVVEEPDGLRRGGDARQGDLVATSRSVDVLVEAIVEEVVGIAPPSVGGTDPGTVGQSHPGVGPPWAVAVGRNAQDAGEINVPTLLRGSSVWGAVLGQSIVVVRRPEKGGDAPLAEVPEASDPGDPGPGLGQGGQGEGGDAGQDGEDRDEFEEAEAGGGTFRPGWDSHRPLSLPDAKDPPPSLELGTVEGLGTP